MSELDEAREEALKYKLLFVAAVGCYGSFLPLDERLEMCDTVVAAMLAVQEDFQQRFATTHIPGLLLAELKAIGDSHE